MRGPVVPVIVLLAAAIVYGALFSHTESIPTAVGANLVPAERVLKGEVPYRDFYKIQTPGILLLNAIVFRLFGTTLIVSMVAVVVFKILTVAMVFVCARFVVHWKEALIAAGLSLVWLAPGGPFRSAPVQFEGLFVVLALWLTLRWMESGRAHHIFLAGLAVGLVAIFKQNVGVYCAVALAISVIVNNRRPPRSIGDASQLYRVSLQSDFKAHIAAATGIGIPLAAMVVYLIVNGALTSAINVFLNGPGEHFRQRFTGYPLPRSAVLITAAACLALATGKWGARRYPGSRRLITTLLVVGALVCAVAVSHAAVNNSIYWFVPMLLLFATWTYFKWNHKEQNDTVLAKRRRGALLTLVLFSTAFYGEVFPRAVRGLVIDTMPPAFVLLVFLCGRPPTRNSTALDANESGILSTSRGVILVTASVVLLVFAFRTAGPSYFDVGHGRGFHLKANTELEFARGRGVYLTPKRANEVNTLVQLIHSRVEPGSYMFAHSVDATSYYFLADRNSPTAATLWNDTGTNNAERARIVGALREKQVRLVLTSDHAMEAEKYSPLLELLMGDYRETTRIGEIVVLERNY